MNTTFPAAGSHFGEPAARAERPTGWAGDQLATAISSFMDGQLLIRGYDIDTIAQHAGLAELTFLLWFGDLPDSDELALFDSQLASQRQLPTHLLDALHSFPRSAKPVDVLQVGVSLLGMQDADPRRSHVAANQEKAIRLICQLPTMLAAFERIRHGDGVIHPRADLPLAANFLYMLTGREPIEPAAAVLERVMVLLAEHEFAASTLAVRLTTSTMSDLHSGLVAAIATLKGPLHGGANEDVMAMLQTLPSVDAARAHVRELHRRSERVPGFGHRMYRFGDPRAKHVRNVVSRFADSVGNHRWLDLCTAMEQEVSRLWGDDNRLAMPSVDFYVGAAYLYLGVPADLTTGIYVMSRAAGWMAHAFEQQTSNAPIRPRGEYIGAPPRHWVDLDQRGLQGSSGA